jgi:hypothetical protein
MLNIVNNRVNMEAAKSGVAYWDPRPLTPGIEEQMLKRRASYALVATGKDGRLQSEAIFIVVLIPRHVEPLAWRWLWSMGVGKLVIRGEVFEDLCSICLNAMMCVQRGMGSDKSFYCDTTPKALGVRKPRERDYVERMRKFQHDAAFSEIKQWTPSST